MKYPKEVLTKNNEVRVLEEKGTYIKYTYLDPETGKEIKKGKYSLILKSETSKTFEQKRERFGKTKGFSKKHLFIIPIKNNKSMIVKDEEDKEKRKIFHDGKIIEI